MGQTGLLNSYVQTCTLLDGQFWLRLFYNLLELGRLQTKRLNLWTMEMVDVVYEELINMYALLVYTPLYV